MNNKFSEGEIESLFPNAEKLLSLHRVILDKISEWTPKNDTLIEVFTNMGSCYKTYLEYCKNHESAYELYK